MSGTVQYRVNRKWQNFSQPGVMNFRMFASATLNGDGTRQWQVKFQVANSVPYADTSGSDKGLDGVTGVVSVRLSPDGGWVGSATRDFSAVVSSPDLRWSYDAASDEDFNLHLAGDNDTVVSVGQVVTNGFLVPNYAYQRAGYIGEIVRRNANHTKPEYLMAPYFADLTAAADYPVFKRDITTPIESRDVSGQSAYARRFASPRQLWFKFWTVLWN